MNCLKCNAPLPHQLIGRHRHCKACYFVYRTRTHGWETKECAALQIISVHLRKREMARQGIEVYKACKLANQKRRDLELETSTIKSDSSTNTIADPRNWRQSDLGPCETVESLAERLELHSHDHQWLREHALLTLGRLTERVQVIESFLSVRYGP